MKNILVASVVSTTLFTAGAMQHPIEDGVNFDSIRAYTEALRNLERGMIQHGNLIDDLMPMAYSMTPLLSNMRDLTSYMIEVTSAGIRVQEDLRNQLAISKDRIETLEERIAALEVSTKKDREELEKEQSQLASVQKQIQESKDPVEEKKQQEGSFASTGHRESGEFNFGRLTYNGVGLSLSYLVGEYDFGRMKYRGETSKSGTYVEAEGKGEFSWPPFKIIGSFSHNRLDLSNAVVEFAHLKIPFNCGGYFNMENIRRIGGETVDIQKKEITVKIADGSKYIFSQNLIRFVTKDGEIRTYEVEK